MEAPRCHRKGVRSRCQDSECGERGEGLRAQNFLIVLGYPLCLCTHCCVSLHVLRKRGEGSEGLFPAWVNMPSAEVSESLAPEREGFTRAFRCFRIDILTLSIAGSGKADRCRIVLCTPRSLSVPTSPALAALQTLQPSLLSEELMKAKTVFCVPGHWCVNQKPGVPGLQGGLFQQGDLVPLMSQMSQTYQLAWPA